MEKRSSNLNTARLASEERPPLQQVCGVGLWDDAERRGPSQTPSVRDSIITLPCRSQRIPGVTPLTIKFVQKTRGMPRDNRPGNSVDDSQGD